jgi:hypothetical protein
LSKKNKKCKGKGNPKHPGDESSSSDSSNSNRFHSEASPNEPSSSESDGESSSDVQISKMKPPPCSTGFPGLKSIIPRNMLLIDALSYKSYRINNKSQRYYSKVAKELCSFCKKVKPDVPEEFYFSGQDPLSILRFLSSFKLGCDLNGIPEGADLRMLPKFMTGQAQKYDQLYISCIKGRSL